MTFEEALKRVKEIEKQNLREYNMQDMRKFRGECAYKMTFSRSEKNMLLSHLGAVPKYLKNFLITTGCDKFHELPLHIQKQVGINRNKHLTFKPKENINGGLIIESVDIIMLTHYNSACYL
jgi:hypothetical protein